MARSCRAVSFYGYQASDREASAQTTGFTPHFNAPQQESDISVVSGHNGA